MQKPKSCCCVCFFSSKYCRNEWQTSTQLSLPHAFVRFYWFYLNTRVANLSTNQYLAIDQRIRICCEGVRKIRLNAYSSCVFISMGKRQ